MWVLKENILKAGVVADIKHIQPVGYKLVILMYNPQFSWSS